MAATRRDEGLEPVSRSEQGGRLAYDPALDGLRALAVVAVVAFHLWPDRVPGGFLGVDTFFVVSGYLITGLLLAEHRAHGRIALGTFWSRRARRLLPALLLLLLAVAIAAAAWWPAEDLARIRGDSLGGLGYIANWRLVLSGDSYFDVVRGPSPLRHLWSLAIEEQFYVVWPLVVVAALRRGGVRTLRTIIAVGTVASIGALAFLARGADVSRAYYGTDTRAYALLVGAALATLSVGAAAPSRRGRATAAVALLAVAVSWFVVGESTHWLFQWGLPVYAALTVALLATVVTRTAPTWVTRALSARPMVAVGRVSYGLYLWHWPAIVFLSPGRTGWHGPPLVGLQLGAAVVATLASYRLLEQPIRRGAFHGRVALVGIVSAFALTAVAVVLATSAARPTPDYLQQAGNVDERPTIGVGPTIVATTTPPTVGAARHPTHVLLVGDSVAFTFQDELGVELAARGVAFTAATAVGCGAAAGVDPALGVTADPEGVPTAWAATCARSVPEVQSQGLATNPDLVAFYSTWEPSDRVVAGRHVAFGTAEWDGVVMAELRAAVERLTATGAHLVFLTLPPIVDSQLHTVTPEENARRVRFNQLVDAVVAGSSGRASTVDFAGIVCDHQDPCPRSADGVELRPLDGGHFEDAGAALVSARLAPVLAGVDLGPAR